MHATELLDACAQRFGEFFGGVQLGRQQHGETIARNARRKRSRRQSLSDELAELPEYGIANVHAATVIDDMQLIGIDVEGTPMPEHAGVDHCAYAPFECGSGVETAESIVADLDDADRLAPESCGQSGVASGEGIAQVLAEQREHADSLADRRVQGAGENLVRKNSHRTVGGQLIDDNGLTSCLGQRQQLATGAGKSWVSDGRWGLESKN